MSNIFKDEYDSFHRDILKEFLSTSELKQLDKSYTKAKKERAIRKLEIEMEKIQEKIKELKT